MVAKSLRWGFRRSSILRKLYLSERSSLGAFFLTYVDRLASKEVNKILSIYRA